MLDKTRSLTQYFRMRDLWTLNFILSLSPFPFFYSLIWFVCAIVYIIVLYRTASTTVAVIICMTKALKSFRSRVCQVENDYSASWQTMYNITFGNRNCLETAIKLKRLDRKHVYMPMQTDNALHTLNKRHYCWLEINGHEKYFIHENHEIRAYKHLVFLRTFICVIP